MAFRLAKIYGPLGLVKPKKLRPLQVEEILKITTELRKLQLKPATKIESRFDPFHENVKSVRDFVNYLSAARRRTTNPGCIFKTEVCCDRSDPTITVTLADKNRQLIFKTANLSIIELLQLFNKYVSSTYVEEVAPEVKLTKSMSKAEKLRK